MPTLKEDEFGLVIGCINPQNSLHRPPASELLQSAWLYFIFHGNVPTSVGNSYFSTSRMSSFSNLLQYQEGFAERLHVTKGFLLSMEVMDAASNDEMTTHFILDMNLLLI
ncbi:hypothetical protein CHARACLAT_027260 [Characodon lateralis]|uniref:Uncharacterized protein n=1 Tax=Characodon lateralis TaxID=208331 RepID=A0ABU7DP52_9TELE|nr:hypothetical protein [Characodon lateralis]